MAAEYLRLSIKGQQSKKKHLNHKWAVTFREVAGGSDTDASQEEQEELTRNVSVTSLQREA